VKDQCIGADLTQFRNQDIFKYFDVSEEDFKAAAPIKAVLDSSNLGLPDSPLPQMPLYVYHAVNDEIVPPESVDAYVSLRT